MSTSLDQFADHVILSVQSYIFTQDHAMPMSATKLFLDTARRYLEQVRSAAELDNSMCWWLADHRAVDEELIACGYPDGDFKEQAGWLRKMFEREFGTTVGGYLISLEDIAHQLSCYDYKVLNILAKKFGCQPDPAMVAFLEYRQDDRRVFVRQRRNTAISIELTVDELDSAGLTPGDLVSWLDDRFARVYVKWPDLVM